MSAGGGLARRGFFAAQRKARLPALLLAAAEHYLPQPKGPEGLWLDVMDRQGGQLLRVC